MIKNTLSECKCWFSFGSITNYYGYKCHWFTETLQQSCLMKANNLESSNPVAYSRPSCCTSSYFPYHPNLTEFIFCFSMNRSTIILIKLIKPNTLKSIPNPMLLQKNIWISLVTSTRNTIKCFSKMPSGGQASNNLQ